MMVSTIAAGGEWRRDETSIAWMNAKQTVWRFSFDPRDAKPFFDPLSVAGGASLTAARPEDHPWHYGLWFSWKYINTANYWEQDKQTGRAEGTTTWKLVSADLQPDGRATLRMDLTYTHPSGRVDLREARTLQTSAPAADGSYIIEWRSNFKAGSEGALLDRNPMPGEPNGQVNGGYAGLSLRLASQPEAISFVSTSGPITEFTNNRARPAVAAIGVNVGSPKEQAGAIAIVSDPANSGADAPWYLVHSSQMRFACAALLAPKPIRLAPGGELQLRYLIAVRPNAWDAQALRELAKRATLQAGSPSS